MLVALRKIELDKKVILSESEAENQAGSVVKALALQR